MQIQIQTHDSASTPPARELRRWQREALDAVLEELAHPSCAVVVRAIMGAGKSILISEIVRRRAGRRVLITVPTIALVEQMRSDIRSWTNIVTGVYYTHGRDIRDVTICCLPSLAQLPVDYAPDIWIADECHRTESPDVREYAEWCPATHRVGVTATPWTAEKSKRLELYDELVYEYGAAQALRDGVVVPWRIVNYDGDPASTDDVCLDLIRSSTEGPGVVSAVDIADAEGYARRLTEAGIPARAVHSRQSRSDERAAIAALQAGELRCVVHVNLLSEGRNYPWLRWLCLRRPASNPVRFAQEVGRVLRSAPGKSHATILDPHDLFGEFALDQEAVLGLEVGGEDEPATAPRTVSDAANQLRISLPATGVAEISVAVVPKIRQYLRRILTAYEATGSEGRQLSSRSWRSKPPTPRQRAFLERSKWSSKIPRVHQQTLAHLAHAPGLTCGDVSDLIQILIWSRKSAWPGAYLDQVYGASSQETPSTGE